MKNLFTLVAVIVLAVALSLMADYNPGQVAVFYPPFRIDMSLNMMILLLLGVFLLLYGLVRAVTGAMRLPERVRSFKAQRRREGAHRALREAVLAFAEGRYSKVERLAQEASVEEADDAPSALLAAMAAQRLQEYDRRDRWLEPLLQGDNVVSHAARLVQAEALAEQRQFQLAYSLISPWIKSSRKNVRALQVALKVYQGAERWDEVLKVIRLLSNRAGMHPLAAESITVQAYEALVKTRSGDSYALTALWRQAPEKEQFMTGVARCMALGFAKAGVAWQGRTIIERVVSQRWEPTLVEAYAQVSASQPLSGLERAEAWLVQHPGDRALLSTLAQLCMYQQLWGKAAFYFEKLYAQEATPKVAAHLAMLYEKSGDTAKEAHYRTQCVSLNLL